MGVHLLAFQITGSDAKTKSLVIPMADTESITDIQTFVTNHVPALDAILGGFISKASVQYALTLPGTQATTALDDHPVSHGGLMAFSVTGSAYRKSLYVPAINQSVVGNSLDIPNTGVVATWITDLLSGTEISPTDNFENVLASFLGGKQVDRK